MQHTTDFTKLYAWFPMELVSQHGHLQIDVQFPSSNAGELPRPRQTIAIVKDIRFTTRGVFEQQDASSMAKVLGFQFVMQQKGAKPILITGQNDTIFKDSKNVHTLLLSAGSPSTSNEPAKLAYMYALNVPNSFIENNKDVNWFLSFHSSTGSNHQNYSVDIRLEPEKKSSKDDSATTRAGDSKQSGAMRDKDDDIAAMSDDDGGYYSEEDEGGDDEEQQEETEPSKDAIDKADELMLAVIDKSNESSIKGDETLSVNTMTQAFADTKISSGTPKGASFSTSASNGFSDGKFYCWWV